MFLWVRLVAEELQYCYSDADLEKRAVSLPRGLKEAYDSFHSPRVRLLSDTESFSGMDEFWNALQMIESPKMFAYWQSRFWNGWPALFGL
jgi:hypothetical protein